MTDEGQEQNLSKAEASKRIDEFKRRDPRLNRK
jgi:hypothetical protein